MLIALETELMETAFSISADIESCCHTGRACKHRIGAVTDIVTVGIEKQH
jgi:hypothetical protein